MKEKRIEQWTIMIPYSSDKETEQHYMDAFLCNTGGLVVVPDFHMHLIAYCEEWSTLIETTRIVKFHCSKEHAFFITRSGSFYSGKLNDFKGFRRRKPDNELEDIEPPIWWPKNTR